MIATPRPTEPVEKSTSSLSLVREGYDCAAEGAKPLEPLTRLPPQQILNGMKDRAGVGLDGDPVLGTQDIEIERCHERGERGAGRLVASHLEPVSTGPQVVGVVNHPGG